MPLGARHICPACLSGGIGSEKIPELVSRRTQWSKVSLLMGGLPILLGPFTLALWPMLFCTAPAAIICAIYGWRKPGSVVRGRQRWAAVLGLLLGLVQLGGMAAMFILIWKGITDA